MWSIVLVLQQHGVFLPQAPRAASASSFPADYRWLSWFRLVSAGCNRFRHLHLLLQPWSVNQGHIFGDLIE